MRTVLALLGTLLVLSSCQTPATEPATEVAPFNPDYAERFGDFRVIQYELPGFERLTLQQKKLVYYLSKATLAGRDIYFDQNYEHNLLVRKTIEAILQTYEGNRADAQWRDFLVYAKRFFFSNGIHHHYGEEKMIPGCDQTYFHELVASTPAEILPLVGEMTPVDLADFLMPILYDPDVDAKRVVKSGDVDLVQASAVNYYEGVTQAEVEAFYAAMRAADDDPERPVVYGLNAKLVKLSEPVAHAYRGAAGIPETTPGADDIVELPWCIGGDAHPTGLACMYHEAIEQVVYWLEQAKTVAENEEQARGFDLLIDFYRTGDLETWDEYNIAWVNETEGEIDYINGFIEVYNDPLGFKGYFEGVTQMTDQEASARIATLGAEAQWFEDNAPLLEEHKKENVTGITARVITVAMLGGATHPYPPVGINLPNSNWIRAEHGSKSVSLDNIKAAYERAGTPGALEEFAWDEEQIQRSREHGSLGSKLKVDLHEVIGHASGKLSPGVGTPSETLRQYSNTLEETRADLFALYYVVDPKLQELGLTTTDEVGKAEYDSYIRNGLMLQLRRLELGDDIEQDHMRNRQLVSKWAYELGSEDNVIERRERDGKTFFVINDYEALREIFGQMLREVQRIKSEGDFEAGRNLVETYGIEVDRELHEEVLERYAALDSPPYTGFLNPDLIPVEENGEIVDVLVSYPADFLGQMLAYAEEFGFLPYNERLVE